MICPNCNKEINDNSNFCMYCGYNLDSSKYSNSDIIFCFKCGRKIDANSKFCVYCGTKIEQIVSEKSIDEYLNESREEFSQDNFERALEIYQEAYEKDSFNNEIILGLIKCSFELGKFTDTLSYIRKYENPNYEVLNYKLNSEINLGLWNLASYTINDLITIYDSDINLLFKKVEILDNLNEKDKIIPVYDKIVSLDNENDAAYFNKSKLLFEVSKYDDALESIEIAIKINPLNDYILFKEDIEKKLNKNNVSKNYDDGLDYFLNHDYVMAYEILSQFHDLTSLKIRCECLYRLNNNEEALYEINKILQKHHDAEFFDLKAKILFSMGNKKGAIEFFKKAANLNHYYLSNLALSYGAVGDLDSSKKYYQKANDELSEMWLRYYNDNGTIYLSGFKNDFFNYPHLCCLKVHSFLKKSISFFEENNLKKALKFSKLAKKYLEKLEDFIQIHSLDDDFVCSNFVFLGNSLDCFLQYKKFDFAEYGSEMSGILLSILRFLLRYHNKEHVINYFKDNNELSDFYKSIGNLFILTNSMDLALKYFKMASNFVNDDGETWLYIANLSDENNIVFFNKALFCFERDLSVKYNDKSKKLKCVSLYYLNRKEEAYSLVRNMLSSRYDKNKIDSFIKNLNKKYAG